jgi:hypothetical protein
MYIISMKSLIYMESQSDLLPQAGSEICSTLDIHRILKFGSGYQTVNDLCPDWILQSFKHKHHIHLSTLHQHTKIS